jgi:glycosyl hydrolase family 26
MTTRAPRRSPAHPGRRPARWARPARWLPVLLALTALLAAGCADPKAPSSGSTVRSGLAIPSPTPPHCTVSRLLVPSCGAWWGMYLDTDPGGTGLLAAVAREQRTLGRRLDIIERYHDFSGSGNGIFPNAAELRLAHRHLLLYSWAPAIWSTHTTFRWSAIAAGAYDKSVIVPQARRLAAMRHKVFLTFSAEPDGAVPGNGSAAEFVAAWRHVHDVFRRVGAHNVVWVWTTTGYVPHASTIAALYPGDRYVDWIGYDPYNFFACHHGSWHTFAETVEPFYEWLVTHRLGLGKPIMLPEFGSAPNLGNPGLEAAWFRDIVPVLHGMPRLKALILWNSRTPGCNLLISHSRAAARAYRQAGLNSYLRQALP